MTNKEYIETMIQSNDRIYIDTASLMEVGEMRIFINNNKEMLKASGRLIIVPKAVCLELVRHLGSDKAAKRNLAVEVITLLCENQDIFKVENSGITEEELLKAFADAELLSELTLNKADYDQLLITNDRRLSRDAYNLNQQQSCRGHRIMVCYINKCGELHRCECVNDSSYTDGHDDRVDISGIVEKENPISETIYPEVENIYTGLESYTGYVQKGFVIDPISATAGFAFGIISWVLFTGVKSYFLR